MNAPQLDQIGIVVENMGRSLAFYRLLGLTIPAESDNQPHVEIALPGGSRLAWDSIEAIQTFLPDYHAVAGQGIGLAFRLETPAEVDTTYGKLVAAGHSGRKEPWDASWGQRYALIDDPDGNGIDLCATLSRAGEES